MPGTLLMQDRGFLGFTAQASGLKAEAHCLWRFGEETQACPTRGSKNSTALETPATAESCKLRASEPRRLRTKAKLPKLPKPYKPWTLSLKTLDPNLFTESPAHEPEPSQRASVVLAMCRLLPGESRISWTLECRMLFL